MRQWQRLPKKLWLPPPWKCPRPGWMELWATWSGGRCPCPWQGGWIQMIFKVPSNPNHLMIRWFYDPSDKLTHLWDKCFWADFVPALQQAGNSSSSCSVPLRHDPLPAYPIRQCLAAAASQLSVKAWCRNAKTNSRGKGVASLHYLMCFLTFLLPIFYPFLSLPCLAFCCSSLFPALLSLIFH